MKLITIEATLPDLKGNCYASGRGKATTVRAAAARAIADLFRKPNVSGKRIHTIKATISIVTVKDEDGSQPENKKTAQGAEHAILNRPGRSNSPA